MGRGAERPPSCYDQAIKLLARQDCSRQRMCQKLASRSYEDHEIEETLLRLEQQGYLDDESTARRWAEQRLRRGPLGRRRLWAELRRRGFAEEVAERIGAELVPEDDRALAREAFEQWWRGRSRDPASLARHLDRLGFAPASVGELVSELRERLAKPENHQDARS